MKIQAFQNVSDFIHEVNEAIASSSPDLSLENVKKLMENNQALLKFSQNPDLGQCFHSLEMKIRTQSQDPQYDEYAQELQELSIQKTLDPELIALILNQVPNGPSEVQYLNPMKEVSKQFNQLAKAAKIEAINQYGLSLKDIGFKDVQAACAALKVHGKNLRYLDLRGLQGQLDAKTFKELVNCCPQLEHVFIKDATVTGEDLLAINELNNLKTLVLQNCSRIVALPTLDGLVNLECLDIMGSELRHLPSFEKLEHLRTLKISAPKVTRLPNVDALVKLNTLHILANMSSLPSLNQLCDLESLQIMSQSLLELPSLDSLGRLHTLRIVGNALRELPSLDQLVHLQTMFVSCRGITEFPSVTSLTDLQQLHLIVPQVSQRPSLEGLNKLRLPIIECLE